MSRAIRHMTTFVVACLALGAVAVVHAPSAQARPAVEARSALDLSSGWRFRFGGDAAGVAERDYDDGGWETVSLPHTWNRLGAYQLIRGAESDARTGIGWYRLTVTAPQRRRDERFVLQFDGVGAVASVWVNGAKVGEHRGAFSRFRFDVTDQLHAGRRNLIVVSADNTLPAPGSSTADVLPLSGDFVVQGGLYRGVSLLKVAAAQIDTLDHGGPGIYLRTRAITGDAAEIDLLARLRNQAARSRKLAVVSTIFDAAGVDVAHDKASVTIPGSGTLEVQRLLRLPRPTLWQGRKAPYLYSVVVELRDGKRVVDRVVQPLGVRNFKFDAEQGFVLNGEKVRLFGASRHQDAEGRGWALSPADHARDMALMTEMGLNAVRHAHYQHAQEWADEADRAGMVVWAELPFVHESSLTNEAPTPALVDNARIQLIELIRQNYNHPSIMIWSVGNEIDIGASIAAMSRKGDGKPARSLGLLKLLNDLAHREDASRPTAYADCCEATPLALKGAEILSGTTDIAAFNRYFGWYYGAPETVGRALDGFHAKYPSHPIMLSEFGAGGALTQHTDNPEGGPVDSRGRPHPEEFQSWVHERSWAEIAKRGYLAGAFIWNMFDFGSTMREEGDAIDLNDKGLVTFDRQTRKDAFYFYKANLSDAPVVRITGRRYTDRAYAVTDVRAYSNAAQASLTLNGRPLGSADCPERICVWRNVALAAGRNDLTVSALFAGKTESDSVAWTAPDPSLGLNLMAGTLTGATSGGVRFGSDTFFAGGSAHSLNSMGFGSPTHLAVATASQPELYRAYREGEFRYELSLPDGSWFVTLHMFEPSAEKAATRRFDVLVDGNAVLKNFNPAAAAGGTLKSVTRRFPVVVRQGRLSLQFRSVADGAVVSAISISKE